jgi:hypothetical protein
MRGIVKFAPLLSTRGWEQALGLMGGAVVAPGTRTVTAILRVRGLREEVPFPNSQRVLNRARWASLAGARELLGLLVRTVVPVGPIAIGVDDTLERRRGAKTQATGS